MDHDRQPGCTRQFHLPEEYLLLQLAGRVIVVVVESDFSPGNDLGALCQLLQFLKIGIGGELGFVGMNADGGVNKLMPLSQLNAAVERSRTSAAADGDDLFNAASSARAIICSRSASNCSISR